MMLHQNTRGSPVRLIAAMAHTDDHDAFPELLAEAAPAGAAKPLATQPGERMPVYVPLPDLEDNPFVMRSNPANRLAHPPLVDGGCGKCGAPAQMFRRIRWYGMRVRFCARCGCDHTTRAGPGTPDECGAPAGDSGAVCGRLQPCPVRGASGVASPYGPVAAPGRPLLAV